MPPGVKVNWSAELEDKLIEMVIRCNGIVRTACKATGVARSALYAHRAESATFRAKLENARRVGAQVLEDVCLDEALSGTLEPVFHGGTQAKDCHGNPAFIRKIPWGARMTLLAGAMPDKYGKRRHEVSGPDGGPIRSVAEVRIYLPDNGRGPRPQAGGAAEEAPPDALGRGATT